MLLLENHLEQIATSAKAIADLEFPPPRIFTNALLGRHEITTLIRDTEPHERSLFSVNPNATKSGPDASKGISTAARLEGSNRRKTVNIGQNKQGSAVARVLGSDMLRQIQQSSRGLGRSRGVDVEVLLQGAERLCSVYPVSGARERISKLRGKYSQLSETVSHYERLVLKQQTKLANFTNQESEEPRGKDIETKSPNEQPQFLTEEDLQNEEDEIRELEIRKKKLEDRVSGIEKDLGGLLR